MTEIQKKQYFGVIYMNGNLSVAFYIDNSKAMEIAKNNPEVMAVYGPFEAEDKYEARYKTDELHANSIIPLRICEC